MNFLRSLAGWATQAWDALTGLPADVGAAWTKLWNFVNSLSIVLSWVVGSPLRGLAKVLGFDRQMIAKALDDLLGAQQRAPQWTWQFQVFPVKADLERQLARLAAWTRRQFWMLWTTLAQDVFNLQVYIRYLVSAERRQRIAAVAAEHAAMLAAVKALHQQVEREASSGYNAGSPGRGRLIATLLDDLAGRTPAIKDLTTVLVHAVLDLETIDNPVLRLTIGHLLTEVIDKAGIDAATADLVKALLGPYADQPKAKDLYGTANDLARRVSALESWVTQFMADGGPEVEQAGKAWKDLTSVLADAAILVFAGQAVKDPQGWAREISATVGVAGNAAMTGIVDLIHSA